MENIPRHTERADKKLTREACLQHDLDDPLQSYRGEFLLGENTIYLDGNSLGPLPKRVMHRVGSTTRDEWGSDLIKSWNKHQWIDLPVTVGEKIAKLIGAQEGQVICCDSVSVNLFKLISAAMHLQDNRRIVLSQRDNFPTDLYMAQGLSTLVGEGRCELNLVESEDLSRALTEDVSVLLLTHVNFRSGERHDMKALTELAHRHGVLVIWDLSHSTGAFPIALDECKVDFAVGCGYKYLNGGPGAPAFIYAAKRHHDKIMQPLCGWMGHNKPFTFEASYRPAEGVQRFLCGTPPILSMAALDTALDVFLGVALADIDSKSKALSELFIQLVKTKDALTELQLLSPTNVEQRGSQLAYTHEHAFAISQALIDDNIIVDFREPNIIRFGFTPLYLRFVDIFDAVEKLAVIVKNKTYMQERFQTRAKVT